MAVAPGSALTWLDKRVFSDATESNAGERILAVGCGSDRYFDRLHVPGVASSAVISGVECWGTSRGNDGPACHSSTRPRLLLASMGMDHNGEFRPDRRMGRAREKPGGVWGHARHCRTQQVRNLDGIG